MLAFVGETRILEINAEDELDEAEIDGFDAEQQVHTRCVFLKSQSQHNLSRELECICVGIVDLELKGSIPIFSLSCTYKVALLRQTK